MKQTTMKEFMEIAKKKELEKEKEEEVDKAFKDSDKDPEDTSRAATIRETIYKFCHIKEFVHQAPKENDQKWILMSTLTIREWTQ